MQARMPEDSCHTLECICEIGCSPPSLQRFGIARQDMTEAMLVRGALAKVNFNLRFVVEGAFQKMFQNRNGGINARTNIFKIDPKRDVGPAYLVKFTEVDHLLMASLLVVSLQLLAKLLLRVYILFEVRCV